MKYDIVKLMARRKIRWKKRWVSGDSGGRLTFRSKKAGRLSDYRIYGNTVDGESVGDRTGNLFDGVVERGSFNGTDGTETVAFNNRVRSKNVTLGGGNYTISANGVDAVIVMVYLIDGTYARSESIASFPNLPFSFSLDAERIIRFAFKKNDNSGILPSDISNMMLNSGSTALPYEPYGYRVPVTISNGNDSQTIPIYLSEQIKKVGDEAEYISYSERKLHRVGADDIDVTLPALPVLPGTNVLSVGTAVQPSRVEVKGRIKAVGQETEPEQEAAEPEPETAEPEQEAAEAEQE